MSTATEYQKRPNFVFVFADDWGWGDLGCYGHPQVKTPRLDAVAAQGTLFSQFYVASGVCSPSRAAAVTGCFPARWAIHGHFADHNLNAERGMPNWLDPEVSTYMRLLQSAGYRTGHFGKWHLGHGPGAPEPYAYGIDECRINVGNGPQLDFGGDTGSSFIRGERHRSSQVIVDETISFINRNRDQAFCVNVWLNDTHAILDPSEAQLEPYAHLMPEHIESKYPGALAVYYATVTNADHHIGRLLDHLVSTGLDDNTVFIFSADNGPEDIHVRNAAHSAAGSSGPFRGRKRSLYEGGVRTPFILRWPAGGATAGMVNNTTALSAVDLLPTFCALAGVDPSSHDGGNRHDGENMADVFRGQSRPRTTPLCWEWRFPITGHPINKSPLLGIFDAGWKLLFNPSRDRVELFDVQKDPMELNNCASHYPLVVDRLANLALAWQKTLPPGPIAANAGSNAYPWPQSRSTSNVRDAQLPRLFEEDAVDVQFLGDDQFIAPLRNHHQLSFRIQLRSNLEAGSQFRMIIGRWRTMMDNNPQRARQWTDFQARLETEQPTVDSPTISTIQQPPRDFKEIVACRVGNPTEHRYGIGVARVEHTIAAGAVIVISVQALLSHQAPSDGFIALQAKTPDQPEFVDIGPVQRLTGLPGPACAIVARLRHLGNDEAEPGSDLFQLHLHEVDAVGNPLETVLSKSDLDIQILGPAELVASAASTDPPLLRVTGDDPVRVRVGRRGYARQDLTNPVTRRGHNQHKVYFGEIHWHSLFSGDGDRSVSAGYRYARDVLGLDFAAVSDHTPVKHWSQILSDCEQFNQPGRFVTIPAWEWSTTSGHSNVYLRTPTTAAGPSLASTAGHPGDVDWPADCVVIPHHTNIRSQELQADGSHYWTEFDWARRNRRVRLVEIVQARGNFEADALDKNWGVITANIGASVQDALDRGYRIGFVGGTDNHSAFPTRNPDMGGGFIGLTAVLADDLSREAIWRALDARRCYATSGVPILGHWTLNGHSMGEEAPFAKRVSFTAQLHGTAPIDCIEVVSQGRVVWSMHPNSLDVTIVDTELPSPPGSSAYYYLRLRQYDGHRAWLSPVWVGKSRGH